MSVLRGIGVAIQNFRPPSKGRHLLITLCLKTTAHPTKFPIAVIYFWSVFEQRYKAFLVDRDNYLLQLVATFT